MAKFFKDILKADTYQAPKAEVVVTPERLKRWAASFRRLSSAGWEVPVGWDHAKDIADSVPVKFSSGRNRWRSAKDTAGYLRDFRVNRDGKWGRATRTCVEFRRRQIGKDGYQYDAQFGWYYYRHGRNGYVDEWDHSGFGCGPDFGSVNCWLSNK